MRVRKVFVLPWIASVSAAIILASCGGSDGGEKTGVQANSTASAINLIDVTNHFDIEIAESVVNKKSKSYDIDFSFSNSGSDNIHAPLHIVVGFTTKGLANAPGGGQVASDPAFAKIAARSLVNKTGIGPDGHPYIAVPLLDGYAVPGEKFLQTLNFSGPDRKGFDVVIQVLAQAVPAELLGVEISEPASANLNSPRTTIAGEYFGPKRTSVVVNGVPACRNPEKGYFYINNFPVDENLTALTATAASPAGAQAQYTVAATGAAGLKGIEVTANFSCAGIPPLDAIYSLGLINLDYSDAKEIRADFDGDGVFDASSADLLVQGNHTYDQPGLYRAKFVLEMKNGDTYETEYIMDVVPYEQVGKKPFEEAIADLKSALAVGNTVHALEYFVNGAEQKYANIFEALGDQLPFLVSDWSSPVGIYGNDSYVEFAIVRPVNGVDYAFTVSFIKDQNGIWKISSL